MSAAPGTLMGGTDPRVRARQRHAFAVEPTVAMIVALPPPPPSRIARGSFSDLPITERTREPPLSPLVMLGVLIWCFTIAFAVTVGITTALD